MPKYKDVAEWMLSKIDYRNTPQSWLANEIKKEFGNNYIYYTNSGNIAINKDVIKEFKKLRKDTIRWDRSAKAWSKIDNV